MSTFFLSAFLLHAQYVPANGYAPMAQTQEVLVLSAPTTVPGAGEFSIFDQSGASLMVEGSLGNNSQAFTLDSTGSYANMINGDGTSNYFVVNLTSSTEGYNTMPLGSTIAGIFSPGTVAYFLDVANNTVDIGTASQGYKSGEFSISTSVPVAVTPVAMAGVPYNSANLQRYFVISQNIPYGVVCNNNPWSVSTAGEADALEVSSNTVSARLPLGSCPVYAVASPDGKRVFVLNRGSDSVTVINSIANTLDSCQPFSSETGQTVVCHPSLVLAPAAGNAHAGPVYAEYVPATSQLVVANYDGNSVSIIDVSTDIYGNDSPSFGTTFTVPVGRHPAGLTVFPDGSRAYVTNQQDGSVSIVDLRSHFVVKTLGAFTGSTRVNPRSIVSTATSSVNSTAMVYVASPNTNNLEILSNYKEGDAWDNESNLVMGEIVDVRVSNQLGGELGNSNYVSRMPGAGQPCNLPNWSNGSTASIAACQSLQPPQ
jgi:YVTN family beta-propeller protein